MWLDQLCRDARLMSKKKKQKKNREKKKTSIFFFVCRMDARNHFVSSPEVKKKNKNKNTNN